MRIFTIKRFYLLLGFLGIYFLYELAFGSSGGSGDGSAGHGGPILNVLLQLVVILLAAKLGGDLFERFKQPAVLGELVIGMLIGNAVLFVDLTGLISGYLINTVSGSSILSWSTDILISHNLKPDFIEFIKSDITLEILAEMGVILLLFEVGLESTVKDMMKVGLASFMVAVFGVVAPFFLGWGVSIIFLPEASIYVHIFIGATLTATSVGITARVLKDIGKIQTRESKIILGAAVIDDILGLVILAVVAGIITTVNKGGEGVSSLAILWIITKAVLFIVGAIIIGSFVLPYLFNGAFKLKVKGVFLSICLLICFASAYIAGLIGLAPIVGAFAAGLILEEIHFTKFRERGEHTIEELIEPIAVFLVPIFFVRMGMMVDLTTFAHVEILGFAAVMTFAAIIGKQVCSLAIFDKTTNRIAIGLGMIPRGEVGLIFAGIGAKLMLDGEAVISTSTYSAVVIMVIVTTLVTPPALKFAMLKGEK